MYTYAVHWEVADTKLKHAWSWYLHTLSRDRHLPMIFIIVMILGMVVIPSATMINCAKSPAGTIDQSLNDLACPWDSTVTERCFVKCSHIMALLLASAAPARPSAALGCLCMQIDRL